KRHAVHIEWEVVAGRGAPRCERSGLRLCDVTGRWCPDEEMATSHIQDPITVSSDPRDRPGSGQPVRGLDASSSRLGSAGLGAAGAVVRGWAGGYGAGLSDLTHVSESTSPPAVPEAGTSVRTRPERVATLRSPLSKKSGVVLT